MKFISAVDWALALVQIWRTSGKVLLHFQFIEKAQPRFLLVRVSQTIHHHSRHTNVLRELELIARDKHLADNYPNSASTATVVCPETAKIRIFYLHDLGMIWHLLMCSYFKDFHS